MNPYDEILSSSQEKEEAKALILSVDNNANSSLKRTIEVSLTPPDAKSGCPIMKKSRQELITEEGDVSQQLTTTIQKLCAYLLIESKFLKAVDVMTKLISQNCNDETFLVFYPPLNDLFMKQKDKILQKDLYNGFLNIFNAISTIKYTNIADNPRIMSILETWRLLIQISGLLKTDDSFQFSKACAVICISLVNFPQFSKGLSIEENDSFINDRAYAILACIQTACKNYSVCPWAKQPVDQIFMKVSEVRTSFPNEIRHRLDECTTSIAIIKRKETTGRTGPVTIRAQNSIAHPLRTLKTDILK